MHRLRRGSRGKAAKNLVVGATMRGSRARHILAAPPGLARPLNGEGPQGGGPVQYASRLPQPSRTLVVPLLAAALGAGVATATFALVNIEDNASVSLPAVVQSAPPSTAVAGERNDGGPAEGTAQQIMRPAELSAPQATLQGAARMPHSLAASNATAAPRYDGGPNEGASANAIADTQPPKGLPAHPTPRYDGGPDEGASAGAIAQP
jgi:hypothetical protein